MTLFLILLALGPSMAWMYWLWRRDKYQREPKGLVLLLLFVGGLIAVIGTLVAVSLYEGLVPSEEAAPVTNMLLTAALPEEIFKMLPVLLFAWRSRHWDEPFDGIVYAGATALGFNLIETAGYMLGEESFGGTLFQGIVRGTLGGHMVYGIIMGFFLSRARFSQGLSRWRNLALALAVPVALHTAWNSALSYGGDIIAGNNLAGTFAWGLSTVLWLVAFEFIRRNRDASYWNPLARTLQIAPVPCWHCHHPLPVNAVYCHTCGAQVGGQAAPH
ncbi:MAG TPA: PrsW family glutamic-type intramembrane protease [Symbiobacteriaceae bacterium]|nr:PrsW family glutamic-type intramembrane protease [Symbiobacteriaceae bacterium]